MCMPSFCNFLLLLIPFLLSPWFIISRIFDSQLIKNEYNRKLKKLEDNLSASNAIRVQQEKELERLKIELQQANNSIAAIKETNYTLTKQVLLRSSSTYFTIYSLSISRLTRLFFSMILCTPIFQHWKMKKAQWRQKWTN